MSVLTRLTAGHKMKDPREGAGGFDALTEADINFAVSTLPAMDAAILLAGHIQQEPPPDQMAKILDKLEWVMYKDWQRQGLSGCKVDKLPIMAEMAWVEFVTGKSLPEEQKADECGMHRNSWSEKYRRVYPSALGELNHIQRRAYSRVKGVLK